MKAATSIGKSRPAPPIRAICTASPVAAGGSPLSAKT
nr:MAG TPA: hypothetical protein [Caudoviricetes sp.]